MLKVIVKNTRVDYFRKNKNVFKELSLEEEILYSQDKMEENLEIKMDQEFQAEKFECIFRDEILSEIAGTLTYNEKLVLSLYYIENKSDEDKYYLSKTEMLEKLIVLFGGRAAEKIIIGDISTGASNDIEVATNLAKEMISVYGMSDKIGPISLKGENGELEFQMFGKDIEDDIGYEVKKMLDDAYYKAQVILRENIDKLHEVAQALIKKEKINEEEFKKIFE